jgi:hypothetical protein
VLLLFTPCLMLLLACWSVVLPHPPPTMCKFWNL